MTSQSALRTCTVLHVIVFTSRNDNDTYDVVMSEWRSPATHNDYNNFNPKYTQNFFLKYFFFFFLTYAPSTSEWPNPIETGTGYKRLRYAYVFNYFLRRTLRLYSKTNPKRCVGPNSEERASLTFEYFIVCHVKGTNSEVYT